MAYAVVQKSRGPFGWEKVGVWMAVPRLVQYRVVAGDPALVTFAEAVMEAASLPEDRSWVTWLEEQALERWSNGHDRAFLPVEPEATIERLFEREVLGRDPATILSPELRPTTEAPTGLGGWKQIPEVPR